MFTIHTIAFTSYDRYVVQGPNGWVGHYTITEPMRDDMPEQLAACFSSTTEAQQVIDQLEAR